MRIVWLLLLFLLVIVFNLYLQPLERVPSTVYSYLWSIVVLIKLIDITFNIVIKKPVNFLTKLNPILIGILIGGYITSVKVLPISFALIRDSFFMLAPLFVTDKLNDTVSDK